MKNKKFVIFLMAAGFVFVLSALALQQGAETAKDPVCGMTIKKATAAATAEYKGMTYYFCNTGCKDAFLKDPEKYLKNEAPQGQMMGGMMGGKPGMRGQMMAESACPMMLPDATRTIENTADGIIIKISSTNPETVKKIQEHGAMMKDQAGKGMAGCPMMMKKTDK